MRDKEIIFAEDEMTLMRVEKGWNVDTVLSMKGTFWLKDIIPLLTCSTAEVSRHYTAIQERGEAPYKVMGVRKTFNFFQVRMVVFAPYYREHLKSPIRSINQTWDAKTLLHEQGWFYLADVCKVIPFTPHYLRVLSRHIPDTKDQCGLWKEGNRWVVDMKVFAAWIKTRWLAKRVREQSRNAVPIGALKDVASQFNGFEEHAFYTDMQAGNRLAVTRYGQDATSQQRQEGFRVALYLATRYLPKDADGFVEGSKAWFGVHWITACRRFLKNLENKDAKGGKPSDV